MKTPKEEELIAYITSPGENSHIDAKRAMAWDGDENSARLTKHILGFANSQDGGVLVIGKEESSPGKFELKGLSSDQADTFDQTEVAKWVNARCSPTVNVQVCRQVHEGNEFVVIIVEEFDDVPILCTRQHPPSGKKDLILRKGMFYVRNSNAQTAGLSSANDTRRLVGLAAKKQAKELMVHFNAMLEGRALLAKPSDEERIRRETETVNKAIESGLSEGWKNGSWTMMFHPVQYVERRWDDDDIDELERVITKRAVRLRDEFPGIQTGTHARAWGIANDTYGEAWGLTRSGLFMLRSPFRENRQDYESPYTVIAGKAASAFPAGKWLAYQWQMYGLAEFFHFMSRFAEEFDPGMELKYRLVAQPLSGKSLATMDPNVTIAWEDCSEPCRENVFSFESQKNVEVITSLWEDLAATAMKSFFELFPGPRVTRSLFAPWIEKYKRRMF